MNSTQKILAPRHLSSLFADDLRNEINGKVSIIGLYQGKMLVPEFPTVVPKLAILMSAVTDAKEPFSKLIFKILKDGELIEVLEVPESELLEQGSKQEELAKTLDENTSNIMEVQFAVNLAPMTIDSECLFTTCVETDSGSFAGRSLRIFSEKASGANEKILSN